MGLMDKFKEVAKKATEVWDEAAENRAKMRAADEAAADPVLAAKVADVETLGSIFGKTLEAPIDRSYSTHFGFKETMVVVYHEKTNAFGKSVQKIYLTEFDMFDIDEFRYEKASGNHHYFGLTLTDGTAYSLSCQLRKFEGRTDEDKLMALEEMKSWIPFFQVISMLLNYAKDEVTQKWINDFMIESGGEAVFVDGKVDTIHAMKVCEKISVKKAAEIKALKRACGPAAMI